MDSKQNKKLKFYQHALLTHLDFIKVIPASQNWISNKSGAQIVHEIEDVQNEFPGFLPVFNEKEYLRTDQDYDRGAMAIYLSRAIARLGFHLDESEDIPVTEDRSFAFLRRADLRGQLERDYPEIQRAFIARCWKAVIVLSGGAIEAILLDLVLRNEAAARACKSAPPKPLDRWNLESLISVCVELGIINRGVDRLSHSVREYRNLIHPGNEIRSQLNLGKEEARIALEILNMIQRDLSQTATE